MFIVLTQNNNVTRARGPPDPRLPPKEHADWVLHSICLRATYLKVLTDKDPYVKIAHEIRKEVNAVRYCR